MKKLVLTVASLFFFSGCVSSPMEQSVSTPPNFIVLENESGAVLGRGFAVNSKTGVAPDHLFEREKALYWKGELLEVLVRDFEKDIIIFRLPKKEVETVELSNVSPTVGRKLFWFDEMPHQVEVLGMGVDFQANGQVKRDLILLSGVTNVGASGSVLYDKSGLVLGMIIGADSEKGQTFAVRTDSILALLEGMQ